MMSTLDLLNWNPFTNTNTTTTNYFGCNIDDRPTEHHVLENVGSYGYQLNRIIDVVELLIAKIELKLQGDDAARFNELKEILSMNRAGDEKDKKTAELQKAEKLKKSEKLEEFFSKERPADEKRNTDESLKKIEAFVKMAFDADKAANDFAQRRVDDLLDAMRSLKKSDSYMYKVYRQQIANDLELKS